MRTVAKSKNLSLQTLLNRMPRQRPDLEEELDELRRHNEPIRLARHKIFAHRDEERSYSVAYGEDEEIKLVTDEMLSEGCRSDCGSPRSNNREHCRSTEVASLA